MSQQFAFVVLCRIDGPFYIMLSNTEIRSVLTERQNEPQVDEFSGHYAAAEMHGLFHINEIDELDYSACEYMNTMLASGFENILMHMYEASSLLARANT